MPEVRDGLLYGRGAADMKGSLAAMVVRLRGVSSRDSDATGRGRIGFLITSDEEGPATDGTVRVVQWLQERGEPRSTTAWWASPRAFSRAGRDVVKNGRRGSLNGSPAGCAGGRAMWPTRSTPTTRCIARLPALARAVAARSWDDGQRTTFPRPAFQITNASRRAAGATNVIPGELELLLNLRFNTRADRQTGLQAATSRRSCGLRAWAATTRWSGR